MHAQYASAHVLSVAQSIACCVIAEFTHGVQHPLMMMHIPLCADFAPLPLVDVLIFKCIMFR